MRNAVYSLSPCDAIEPGERWVVDTHFSSPVIVTGLMFSDEATKRRDAEIERLSSVETMLHELYPVERESWIARWKKGLQDRTKSDEVLAFTSHNERRRARRERRRRRRLQAFLVVESVLFDNHREILMNDLPCDVFTYKPDDDAHSGFLMHGYSPASALRFTFRNVGTWRSTPFRASALVMVPTSVMVP